MCGTMEERGDRLTVVKMKNFMHWLLDQQMSQFRGL